jgi:hypothetical protein
LKNYTYNVEIWLSGVTGISAHFVNLPSKPLLQQKTCGGYELTVWNGKTTSIFNIPSTALVRITQISND